MTTIIDSLVVTLGLDTKQFSKAQQEAMAGFKKYIENLEKGGKEAEAHGKRIVDFFQTLKREVVAFAGVAFGGYEFKQMITNITTMDASIGRMSRTSNTSVKDLSMWRSAIQYVGGDAEEASASIQALNDAVMSWSTGHPIDPNLASFLNRIPGGFALAKSITAGGGDTSSLLFSARQYMDQNHLTPAQTRAMFLGAPGMTNGMIDLLVSPDFYHIINSVKALGGATAEATKTAEKYQESVGGLSQAWTNLERTITNIVAPSLIDFMTKLLDFAKLIPTSGGTDSYFPDWLTKITKGMENIMEGKDASPLWTLGGGSDVKAGAGTMSPAIAQLKSTIESSIPGIYKFTAFNDEYHSKDPNDPHAQGRALDLTVMDRNQAAAIAQQIRNKMKAMGIEGTVVDEYLHPSKNATGPHLHVQLAKGGAGGAGTNSKSTTIGTINVYTQATDAKGIAKGLGPAISSANSGLQ